MVSLNDYHKLLGDRPKKFTAEQVRFVMKADQPEHECRNCVSFYRGDAAKRNVCEITTGPDPDSRHIPLESSCSFFSADGKAFPLLKMEKPKRGRNPKPDKGKEHKL